MLAPEENRKPIQSSEYRRIETDLRRQIEAGRWTSGTMMPSRRDLAREYSVSPLTVSRAIGPLLADGTLRSDSRRGTFVAMPIKAGISAAEFSAAPQFRQSEAYPAFRLTGRPLERIGQKTVAIITFFRSEGHQDYVILRALEQIFASAGSVIQVVNRAQNDGSQTLPLSDAIKGALRSEPDGLIIIALEQDSQLTEADLGDVSLRDIPTVCILVGEIDRPIPHVFYDNRSGGYQAMQHLVSRGITEFTVIAPFTATWVSQRIMGCRAAALHAGLPANVVRTIVDDRHPFSVWDNPVPQAYHAVKAEIEAGWTPSGGIICVNDGVALGVMKAAAEIGLHAGKDFAILGFDDDYQAQVHGLTSVRPPLAAMAREAACLLQDHWQGIDSSLQVRLRAHVIPRMSTGT